MKRVSVILVAFIIIILTFCAHAEAYHGNYTDEMKISSSVNLSTKDGADSVGGRVITETVRISVALIFII